MEDPKYTATVTIGGAENNTTDYETDCMGDRIHADQSFILQYTLADGNDAGAFDIATATATLYVTAYKNAEFTPVSLAGGVLTDSGSGTTDRVTFTVAKDLIPDELASFPLRTPGNAVFYAIISDADSKIEIVNFVNVYDDSYGLTSEAQPGANTIVPKGNDLGTVTDYTVTTPPSPTLNLAYIVAPSATGDWAGEDNNLAIGNGTSWIFFTVLDGNFAFDDNSNNQILFDGTDWSETSAQPFTDATALVKNDADPTKLIGFDASAITTATERTITMPDTAVDLGDIATNNAKVTNATHTGEVTGGTTLTVDPTAISNKTLVTAASGDTLLIGDASDSNNLKKVDALDFLGGASLPVADTTSIVEGSVDATKEMRIEVDGLTTGTVRVATMPDADITLGTDADAIHDNVAGEIAAITNKATPVNGDFILIEDSADSNNKKHVLASNFLSGSGDVSASANITDNAIVRGDGGSKGVQDSGILIDDSDNMSGVGSVSVSGDVVIANNSSIRFTDVGATNREVLKLDSSDILRVTNNSGGNGGSIQFKSMTGSGTSMELAIGGEMLLTEIAAPSTPASGALAIYADSTTSLPMAKNDAGTEMQLSNGVYKTISFNAGGMTPRTTGGAASATFETTTNDITLDGFDFDATTGEAVQVAFMMPDDWDLGTIKCKFIWTDAATAGTGSVVWRARAVAISNDDPLDAAFGTGVQAVDPFIASGDNHTTAATGAITVGGTPALGDLVVFEFIRNTASGSDTYTQDARLLNVTMQYKTLDTTTAAW